MLTNQQCAEFAARLRALIVLETCIEVREDGSIEFDGYLYPQHVAEFGRVLLDIAKASGA